MSSSDAMVLQAMLDAEQERYRILDARFRDALRRLGLEPDSVERFLTGDEIESDFLTAADFRYLEALNTRNDAESKLTELCELLSSYQNSNGSTPLPQISEPEHE